MNVESRRSGLGASDAPAALGLSPWKTQLELFLEKTGRAQPSEPTFQMRVGTALEPVVLNAFTDRTGLAISRQQERVYCPRYAWRWATVDAIASDGALVEAKTASDPSDWGEEGTDQIPAHYIVQVQHALACTGLTLAYVPVLIRAQDFRVYEVRRDEAIIDALTEREREFWQRVERDDPPPLTSASDLKLRWPVDNGAVCLASDAILAQCAQLRAAKAARAAIEEQIEALEIEIKNHMGEAAQLIGPDGECLATWKASKPAQRFDAEAFRLAHPDLYAAFRKAGAPVRRFLLKD